MKPRSRREALQERLLASTARLPTSSLSRLGRTALTAFRGLGLERGDNTGLDAEALAKIVQDLGQLKGIAMKAGQIMSYVDVALPDELREVLAVLQTHSQPIPMDRVTAILKAELGERAEPLLETMDSTPVAAASIGQVHRAKLADGRPVAVKIQYPEIDTAIASDFRPAAIGGRLAALLYPGANVRSIMNEARERFLQECDYVHEAESQQNFARIYGNHPVIRVPAVMFEYCSKRVLTSEWIDGASLDEFLETTPADEARDRLGEALFEFYIGTLFRHGLYNCDPHPGNYLFQSDTRVALLDYGCTRAFAPEFVKKLAALSAAVHSDDTGDLHRAFVDLGMVGERQSYDFETARDLVRGFYGPMLLDETRAIDPQATKTLSSIIRDKRKLMKLRLPGEFLFLFRIRFGLMSVLARLGARANWYRLERRHIEGQ